MTISVYTGASPRAQVYPKMSTTPHPKKPSIKLSTSTVKALLRATPEERAEATRIASKLLARRDAREATGQTDLTQPYKAPPLEPAQTDEAPPIPPTSNRLTPSEIESLRQDAKQASAWMKAQLEEQVRRPK